jgi:hypothetical protein
MAHPNLHAKSSAKKFGGKPEGKTVYTRYVGEQHVKEDCNNYVPSAKEWINNMAENKRPSWMLKTIKLEFED